MLHANAWHHHSDAVSSAVVLVGVSGTLAGLPYLDAVAAVVIVVIIAHIAWKLGHRSIRELVDTGLEAGRLAAIEKTIGSVGGVRNIHMLRTRKHGWQASLDVHVLVDPRVSVSEGHVIALLVEDRLKSQIDEMCEGYPGQVRVGTRGGSGLQCRSSFTSPWRRRKTREQRCLKEPKVYIHGRNWADLGK